MANETAFSGAMSTRASIFYRRPVHLFVEMMTDWVEVEVGDWLHVRLYKRMRGWRSKWLGRFACYMEHHNWFIEEFFWKRADRRSTYRCLRCGIVR